MHDLTVYHRGAFAVTAAEIETDTAAVEVTAEWNRRDLLLGYNIEIARSDGHWFEEDPSADSVAVEGTRTPWHVEAGYCLRQLRVTGDDDS